MAAGRLYKVNELVQVESIDAGFEGAWFDAAIHKIVNVALPDSGTEAEPRIMYDVKYTRFASAGKPIVESVCEARIRPVPPELVEYEVAVGDHVDAFWRDGWWQGVILKIDEESTVPGENTSKAHVSKGMTVKKYFVGFPQHAHQELCLRKDDLRPVLQLRQVRPDTSPLSPLALRLADLYMPSMNYALRRRKGRGTTRFRRDLLEQTQVSVEMRHPMQQPMQPQQTSSG